MADAPQRHLEAARRHDDAAEAHERSAKFWAQQGDEERAALQREFAAHERQGGGHWNDVGQR